MNKVYLIISFLLFPLFVISGSAATLPSAMHKSALSCLSNVYNEQFKLAKNNAKDIIKENPKHPAGYFFLAAVLNAEMDFLQSEKYETEFYKNCDLAIEKGEKLLESSDDNWVKFFTAGASGFKGAYESRCERWVTAFKQGWRGVSMFKDMLEDGVPIKDVEYGIATYNYWRSAKTKALWWMPGVKDKREESINILYRLVKEGIYVKESSAFNLCNILIDRERYNDAEKLAATMLNKYPKNLNFLYHKTFSQIKQKKYSAAKVGSNEIKQRLSATNFESNYNQVMLNYFLVSIHFSEKKYDLVKNIYKNTINLKLSDVAKDRLKTVLDDMQSLDRDARKATK